MSLTPLRSHFGENPPKLSSNRRSWIPPGIWQTDCLDLAAYLGEFPCYLALRIFLGSPVPRPFFPDIPVDDWLTFFLIWLYPASFSGSFADSGISRSRSLPSGSSNTARNLTQLEKPAEVRHKA